MNKSTVVLLTLAALGLGALIGISFVRPSVDDSSLPVQASHAIDSGSTGGAPVFRYLTPETFSASLDEFGRPLPAVAGENYVSRYGNWQAQTVEIEIPVEGAVEYKVVMAQGDSIVFDWTANGGAVYSDFHGHDKAYGEDFFVRYEESEYNVQSGMLLAAFDGGHGWYWLNLDSKPLSITLRVSGFFKEIIKKEVEQ